MYGVDGAPELVWAYAMSCGEIRQALRIVTEQQEFLLTRWREIHARAL